MSESTEPVEAFECACCGETADDCECHECGGCDQPVESVCSHCDSCSDCCECETCGRCDEMVESVCANCSRCEGCCSCDVCDHCDSPVDSTCPCCDCCERHCDCSCCDGCQEKVESTCGECSRCEDCCTCGDGAVEFFGEDAEPTFHDAETFARNPSRRYVSCELEIASADHGDDVTGAVRGWKGAIVEDGSLPDGGFEICTAPAAGDAFCAQVAEVADALAAQSAKVTPACGYHVHVDARDFSWWDVRRLVLVYQRIEDALFSCVPASRRSNRYCERCGDLYADGLLRAAKETKKQLIENVYPRLKGAQGKDRADRFQASKTNKYNSVRYHALNLHSWLYRGTVECRLAAGTANADKIAIWAILWAGILDFAKSATEAQIAALPADPFAALLAIAPTEEVRAWLVACRDSFAS